MRARARRSADVTLLRRCPTRSLERATSTGNCVRGSTAVVPRTSARWFLFWFRGANPGYRSSRGLSFVLVVPADPVRAASSFAPALRHEIEVVVVQVEFVVAAVVARVGVEHGAALILVEDAVAFSFVSQ